MPVTGPCPDSGSLRGLQHKRMWGPQCPTPSTRGPWENKLTSLCAPATLGVGSGRMQLHLRDLKMSQIQLHSLTHPSAVRAFLIHQSLNKQKNGELAHNEEDIWINDCLMNDRLLDFSHFC